MTDQKIDDWMETASGMQFAFMNPEPYMIRLEDIALALSRTCRYGGHTKRFYSVAEHCCLMSDFVLHTGGEPLAAFTALHHDDAEAYIGDLPRPAKQNMPQFKGVETGIDRVVAERFGSIYPFPDWLKELDTRILVDERAQVINPSMNQWTIDHFEPLGIKTWQIMGRSSWWVRRQWLKRHHKLLGMID